MEKLFLDGDKKCVNPKFLSLRKYIPCLCLISDDFSIMKCDNTLLVVLDHTIIMCRKNNSLSGLI